MAKPIKITPDLIEKAVTEFRKNITKVKSVNGILRYETNLSSKPSSRAIVAFTEKAFYKMKALLDSFTGEVGWFGLVNRIDNGDLGLDYLVNDIMVYPQEVTSATVTTDEKELGAWYDTLSDERLNGKRFHGHSHVNFSPTPSPTDLEDRVDKLRDLSDDDFFVFMIINKRLEYTCEIYDMITNTHYETDDVDVVFPTDPWDFYDKEIKVAKQKVYTTTTYTSSPYNSGNTKTNMSTNANTNASANVSSGNAPEIMRKQVQKWRRGEDLYDKYLSEYGTEYSNDYGDI